MNEFTINYHSVSGVIERVVNHYVYVRRTRIPDMDAQDIAQEIRVKCIQALESNQYDPEKSNGSPYNFLHRCIHNHVYNLRRGTWVPNNPPCVRCDCWDKKERKCTAVDGEDDCAKMQKYRDAMRIKASLRTPIGFDKYCTEGRAIEFGSIEELELDDLIINRLPQKLCNEYMKLRRGEAVKNKKKNELKRAILAILKEED